MDRYAVTLLGDGFSFRPITKEPEAYSALFVEVEKELRVSRLGRTKCVAVHARLMKVKDGVKVRLFSATEKTVSSVLERIMEHLQRGSNG